ncbi:MAG: AP endonuclease [Oscillospiraceae bacterium]|nr:AP endonuclease [Oscillospiraceae bacterium]
MLFRNIELDFDVFDADTADLFEDALKTVKDTSKKKPGESNGDCIRLQCNTVFDFFDALFGEGFHREIFGDRTNLLECISAFKDFNDLVKDQRTRLDALAASINAVPAEPVNREQRRTALRYPRQP